MLVLSRKKSEKILIGDDVTLTLVELRGDKARIGIDAPREVPIHRQEVYDKIQAGGADPSQPVVPIDCEAIARDLAGLLRQLAFGKISNSEALTLCANYVESLDEIKKGAA